MISWPQWWSWELELSPHLLKRMVDRCFTEVELRLMFENATDYHADVEPGRWELLTSHENRPWRVIVEPDEAQQLLVVVTAYPDD